MDQRADKRRAGPLSDKSKAALAQLSRRRPEFPSAAAAFQRLRTAPAFSDWSERALSAYLQYGFESLEDGSVRLLCTPDIETAMLVPIFEAIEQIYTGDERGNPFSWLSEIRCPVRVSTTERSAAIHKVMVSRAAAIVPVISSWHFDGVGHCVAQEAPALLVEALKEFAVGTA